MGLAGASSSVVMCYQRLCSVHCAHMCWGPPASACQAGDADTLETSSWCLTETAPVTGCGATCLPFSNRAIIARCAGTQRLQTTSQALSADTWNDGTDAHCVTGIRSSFQRCCTCVQRCVIRVAISRRHRRLQHDARPDVVHADLLPAMTTTAFGAFPKAHTAPRHARRAQSWTSKPVVVSVVLLTMKHRAQTNRAQTQQSTLAVSQSKG